MKLLILFILAMLPAAQLRAAPGSGTIVGDGGHGIFCPGEGRNRLLESIEAETLYGFKLDTGLSRTAIEDVSLFNNEIIARLDQLDPDHQDQILKSLVRFLEEPPSVIFVPKVPRPVVEPVEVRIDIADCVVLILARFDHTYAGRGRAQISKFEYAGLPVEDKIALLLHETLHGFFGPQASTLAVRQAVIYLSAPANFRLRNFSTFKRLLETKTAQVTWST